MLDIWYRIRGPTVCTQESPFRQFHFSSKAIATHKLNDVTYMFPKQAAAVRHVLRKQRRKRKTRKHIHIYSSYAVLHSIPFLLCPFPKIIYYMGQKSIEYMRAIYMHELDTLTRASEKRNKSNLHRKSETCELKWRRPTHDICVL